MLHERLPLLGPIGSGSSAEDADAIETLIQQGYRTVMIKMGARPVAEEIKRMRAAAERFGNLMTVIVDANQGWQFKEALQFIEGIGRSVPLMIEQPVTRSDIYAMVTVPDGPGLGVTLNEEKLQKYTRDYLKIGQ
jgi:L-alanine-DL-glutamate epimerase-like enolase superfamily enzyme